MATIEIKDRGMASGADFWFVRLPDGRTLRSRSTKSLRQHLKAGRVPWDSRARRSLDEPWQPIEEVPEFADLAPAEERPEKPAKAGEATPRRDERASAIEIRTLGVRGLLEELFNAFDVSLQKAKLTTAAVTGLLMGVAIIFGWATLNLTPAHWTWAVYLATALVLCLLFSACTSIVTQMTALEVSRFRPAHFAEVRAGLLRSTLRLTITFSLVGGVLGGAILLLRSLPYWLTPADPEEASIFLEAIRNVADGARLLFEAICWPLLGFAMLLLGPILIVEEYSIWQGLQAWFALLRQHLGRVYLYQALAFASAAALALPLLAPVLLAARNPLGLSAGEAVPFLLLAAVALTPMLSYLLVAHVFIYLNLRYEFFYSARER